LSESAVDRKVEALGGMPIDGLEKEIIKKMMIETMK